MYDLNPIRVKNVQKMRCLSRSPSKASQCSLSGEFCTASFRSPWAVSSCLSCTTLTVSLNTGVNYLSLLCLLIFDLITLTCLHKFSDIVWGSRLFLVKVWCVLAWSGRGASGVFPLQAGCSDRFGKMTPLPLCGAPLTACHTITGLVTSVAVFRRLPLPPVIRCPVTLSECAMTHSRDLDWVYLQSDLWSLAKWWTYWNVLGLLLFSALGFQITAWHWQINPQAPLISCISSTAQHVWLCWLNEAGKV